MTDPRIEAAAKALWDHGRIPGAWAWPDINDEAREHFTSRATAAIAAFDKAKVIVERYALNEVPIGTVIISEQGGVWEKCDDGETREPRPYWITTGTDEVLSPSEIALPAVIIHWGTE